MGESITKELRDCIFDCPHLKGVADRIDARFDRELTAKREEVDGLRSDNADLQAKLDASESYNSALRTECTDLRDKLNTRTIERDGDKYASGGYVSDPSVISGDGADADISGHTARDILESTLERVGEMHGWCDQHGRRDTGRICVSHETVSAIEGDLSSVGEALGVAFSMFVECMPDAASTVAEELSSVLDAMRESGPLDDE